MERRRFLQAVSVELLSTPLVVTAQARLPLVAILEPSPAAARPGGVAQFRKALGELGWVEGKTVRFEIRYGEWQPDRIARMARELVALKPDVLYTHSDSATRAAMSVTHSIPIVVGAASEYAQANA